MNELLDRIREEQKRKYYRNEEGTGAETISVSPRENLSAEPEIECPRCHKMMMLQSEFDRLYYFCEECCFTLS